MRARARARRDMPGAAGRGTAALRRARPLPGRARAPVAGPADRCAENPSIRRFLPGTISADSRTRRRCVPGSAGSRSLSLGEGTDRFAIRRRPRSVHWLGGRGGRPRESGSQGRQKAAVRQGDSIEVGGGPIASSTRGFTTSQGAEPGQVIRAGPESSREKLSAANQPAAWTPLRPGAGQAKAQGPVVQDRGRGAVDPWSRTGRGARSRCLEAAQAIQTGTHSCRK